MLWFITWFILSILVGVYASSKGRSGIGYFFISLILSPLIGFIIALVVKPTMREGSKLRKCPFCAEDIKAEAIVCKHCGKDVEPLIKKVIKENPLDNDWQETCPECGSRQVNLSGFCNGCFRVTMSPKKKRG